MQKGDDAVKTSPDVQPRVRRRAAQQPACTAACETPAPDFHGASIINEHGKEVPITEAMIRTACKYFIQQWETAQQSATED
jgi:hypothetical protein